MKNMSETELLGIIGYPIKHSLSPLLHNTLFKKLKLNYVYLPFEILPENIENVGNVVKTLNIKGLNVTIPYKEKVLSQMDNIDVLGKEIGAINTIVNKDGLLVGYNTDVYGFVKSLKRNTKHLKGKEVFVLGCGGVSRAIICGLEKLKVKKVYISDIDRKKVLEIKKKYNNFVESIEIEQYDKIFKQIKMFVNATSVGMKNGDKDLIDTKLLNKNVIVYDVIYNRETELVKKAKSIGCITITGLPMFIFQAQKSFQLWTGIIPSEKYMFSVVKRQLRK